MGVFPISAIKDGVADFFRHLPAFQYGRANIGMPLINQFPERFLVAE